MVEMYEKGSSVQLCEEFNSSDFDCKCKRPECDRTLIDDILVKGLAELTLVFPIIQINSGFRCVAHNKEVGGKPDSQHLLGIAADIRSDFAKPKELKSAAELIDCFANGGIGYYSNFIHVDVRTGKARW